ncbi:MAG: hypothetical protein A2189_01615 [Paenibacillus sp. RIFOXYA1_FULL_44_5]|nr:MAG: hypothetical protein A2189_01615 [Paenibacillus sp. RIFOXYA1_FULL_44_5]
MKTVPYLYDRMAAAAASIDLPDLLCKCNLTVILESNDAKSWLREFEKRIILRKQAIFAILKVNLSFT